MVKRGARIRCERGEERGGVRMRFEIGGIRVGKESGV